MTGIRKINVEGSASDVLKFTLFHINAAGELIPMDGKATPAKSFFAENLIAIPNEKLGLVSRYMLACTNPSEATQLIERYKLRKRND